MKTRLLTCCLGSIINLAESFSIKCQNYILKILETCGRFLHKNKNSVDRFAFAVNFIKKKRITTMMCDQMDVSIMNAIHYSFQSKLDMNNKKNDPYMDYLEYLLLKIDKDNFQDIKKSFFRLPLNFLQDKIVLKFCEIIPQFSNQQVKLLVIPHFDLTQRNDKTSSSYCHKIS